METTQMQKIKQGKYIKWYVLCTPPVIEVNKSGSQEAAVKSVVLTNPYGGGEWCSSAQGCTRELWFICYTKDTLPISTCIFYGVEEIQFIRYYPPT